MRLFWLTVWIGFPFLARAAADPVAPAPPADHELETGPPNPERGYTKALEGVPVPVIAHEIGEFQVYPSYDEIPKYTGVRLPRNLEMFRDHLDKAGMLDQWKDFFRASGALAVLCYKEDIEVALRTRGLGGFQILDLADQHVQGTALVGILDAFNESKGLIQPEDWRHFCSSTVPLLRFPKHTWSDATAAQPAGLCRLGPVQSGDDHRLDHFEANHGNSRGSCLKRRTVRRETLL
jgi:hypothetical protein